VLSLYLAVPLDPAGIRGLAAGAVELMACAVGLAGGTEDDHRVRARVEAADREAVLGVLAAHGRDWAGHTVAFFACQELGLFEVLPLPCLLPERAVLTGRRYIRPLLAAVQRCPDCRVVIVDRERARVLAVSGSRVEIVATQVDRGAAQFGLRRLVRPAGAPDPAAHHRAGPSPLPGHRRDPGRGRRRRAGAAGDRGPRRQQPVTGERVGAGLGGRGGPPPRRAPAAGPRVPPAGRSGRGGRQIRRPLACPGTRTATAWNTAKR